MTDTLVIYLSVGLAGCCVIAHPRDCLVNSSTPPGSSNPRPSVECVRFQLPVFLPGR